MHSSKLSQVWRCRASLCSILARYCVLPDPVQSDEQALRRWHQDLPDLSPSAARQELAALNLGQSLLDLRDPWFSQRCQLLKRLVRRGR